MENARIDALRRLSERNPDDPRIHFGLAAEYERLEQWEAAAVALERYLTLADDEGNAWGRLGRARRELGRDEEAMQAYQQGIAAARQHGHPSMAAEFEDVLNSWD